MAAVLEQRQGVIGKMLQPAGGLLVGGGEGDLLAQHSRALRFARPRMSQVRTQQTQRGAGVLAGDGEASGLEEGVGLAFLGLFQQGPGLVAVGRVLLGEGVFE